MRYLLKRKSEFVLLMAAIVLFFCLSNCGDSGNNPSTGTPTELEGTWVGSPVDDSYDTLTISFNGNTFSWSQYGQEVFRGNVSLNTSVTPRQADFTITWCPQGCPYVGKTGVGIYKIYPSGDSVLLAGGEPGTYVRPTDFKPSSTNDVFLMIRQ